MILVPAQAAVVRAARDAGEPRALLVVRGGGADCTGGYECTAPEHQLGCYRSTYSTPDGIQAPAVWVKLDQPCGRCLGHRTVPDSDNPTALDYGYRNPLTCPDCLDGRQVHGLEAQCPTCSGDGCDSPCLAAHPDDGRPHNPCPTCGRDGSVLLARAAVRVLPVTADPIAPSSTEPCVQVANSAGFDSTPIVQLWTGTQLEQLDLDPPRPGVDWVVLLEFAPC